MPVSDQSEDKKSMKEGFPARGLSRVAFGRPALSLAGLVLIAAVMHRHVTGEPLGASLTSPVDWMVIALVVLAFGLTATAVYSFLPAIVTGAIVRSQTTKEVAFVSSRPWFAVVAGLYAAVLSGLVLVGCDPREHLVVYLFVALIAAVAAAAPVLVPLKLRSALRSRSLALSNGLLRRVQVMFEKACERWPRLTGAFRKYLVPFATLLVWLLVTGLVVVVSTVTLASVAGKSEWMADESVTVIAFVLSVLLGLVVSYSALVARRNDRAYVAFLAFFAVFIVAIMGAMPAIYSFALKAAGTGQYTMRTMWFIAESCEIVRSLPGLRVSTGSGDRCVAEDVFVVTLSESLVVIAASQESARAGLRLRLPRAAFLGGVKGPDKVETSKEGSAPSSMAQSSSP